MKGCRYTNLVAVRDISWVSVHQATKIKKAATPASPRMNGHITVFDTTLGQVTARRTYQMVIVCVCMFVC